MMNKLFYPFVIAIFFSLPAVACPPSPPLLYDVPSEKRNAEYETDARAANNARYKLWAKCVVKSTNDCQAQCDSKQMSEYSFVDQETHYKYSSEERRAAEALILALEQKWKSTPSPKSHNWNP